MFALEIQKIGIASFVIHGVLLYLRGHSHARAPLGSRASLVRVQLALVPLPPWVAKLHVKASFFLTQSPTTSPEGSIM